MVTLAGEKTPDTGPGLREACQLIIDYPNADPSPLLRPTSEVSRAPDVQTLELFSPGFRVCFWAVRHASLNCVKCSPGVWNLSSCSSSPLPSQDYGRCARDRREGRRNRRASARTGLLRAAASRSRDPRVQKFGRFSLSEGTSPLPNEDRLGSKPQSCGFLVRELGIR